MKKIIAIVTVQAALLLAAPAAFAQDGEGTVGGEVSAEGSATVSASGDTTAPEVETSATSTGTAGQFGVGFDRTLTGINAAEIVYQLNERMFISGLIGFRQFSPDEGESATAFAIGAGVFYSVFHVGIGDFNIGGRLAYSSADRGAVTASQIDIELPIRVQLRLNRHFAVHLDTGIAIAIANEDGGVTIPADSTAFAIGAGELFATGGFDVFF